MTFVDAGEIRVYRSELIPSEQFWHGFPERHGGISDGPRTSLNLGFRWGDSHERVAENRRLVAVAEGYAPDALVVTKHVHGTEVWRVGEPLPDPPEFDGLVSDKPGTVLGAEDGTHVGGRTVDTHVKRLRKKLGAAASYVTTVRGVGYRFEPQLPEGH